MSVPEGRVEVLTIIERYNTKLCALTKKFDIKDESYHWTHNYHFNFRLYEKLLCSVFDILEDGQLVEVCFSLLTMYHYILSGLIKKDHTLILHS